MLYVLLLGLIGALCYVRSARRERLGLRGDDYSYRVRRERDCWFV